ncbi:MAG: DUF885 domain-containing protein [Acidobacteriota bacterium]|nr:DUF885 domain-containing protein [Acidobacteriota bacterium]
MPSRLTVLLLSLLLTVPLLAATGAPQPGKASDAEFDRLASQFMIESLVLSPVNASQAGLHQHKSAAGKTVALDALLDDVGPEGVRHQREFYRQWRDRFARFDHAPLNLEQQADLKLVEDSIGFSLLELDRIQSYRHDPTGYVELIGNALFLPMTQSYAGAGVRLGHAVSRMEQIPRFLQQARQMLADGDPIKTSTAIEENEGNLDLIRHMVKDAIPAGSPLMARYEAAAPKAEKALEEFSGWLRDDYGKRPSKVTWRLGPELYAEKFRLVMETPVSSEQTLANAKKEMAEVRADMLRLAEPMHREMYPDHGDHAGLTGEARENLIIGEVLARIGDDHVAPADLLPHIQGELDSIIAFIKEKKIVDLGPRNNLKVIATPPFMRGTYSVAGFHNPPPLEPGAEAQYWVTPIDPATPKDQAESKLREYNNWTLKWLTIHEALPGHYVQFEHANDVEPESRRLLRSLLGNGAYIEGWAEYVAQVMLDEGFANNDPRFRLVMRKIRLRVLANTILDIGMHTQGMTDQQAMELMTGKAFQTQAEAEGKLLRAKLTSVQLVTYYVGLHDWLELRRDYMAKKGTAFTNAEFHDRALNEGPLPVMLLRGILFAEDAPAKL